MQNINHWITRWINKRGITLRGTVSRSIASSIHRYRGYLGYFSCTALTAKASLSCALVVLLIACGEEPQNSLSPPTHPPSIKSDTVVGFATGTAALGLTSNADIIAYEINPQQRSCAHNSLPIIGQGKSDSQGDYNITLNLKEPLVLFRLTGGSYIEEASGTRVNLLPGQALYAINRIDSLDSSRPMVISSLSSIHAGLFCHLIEQTDSTVAAAYLEAEKFIVSYTGFDPRYVDYKDPTDASNNRISISLDSGLLLGLLNAGISQYSYDLSIRAEGEKIAHNQINSIYMAQHFFNDIYQDGVLNGQGLNGNIIISLNDYVERLTSSIYKFDLPRATLDFYDNNEHNKITKDRSELYQMTDTMNTATHVMVFPDQDDTPALDEDAPAVVWMYPTILSGVHNITLKVTDLTSVRDLALMGREDIAINEIANNVYSFRLDTSDYASGEHQFSIMATDTLGNQASATTSVVLINDAPKITVASPRSTKDQTFRFEFEIEKVHSRQKIDPAKSKCVVSSGIRPTPLEYSIASSNDLFWCSVELQPTINNIQVVVCDTNSLCNARASHTVKYDIEPPSIQSLDLMKSYKGNVSFRIDVEDALSDLNGLPRFAATGNGEILQGELLPRESTILNSSDARGYLIFFDAARFGNGNIDIEITASDTENNHGSKTFTTLVVNQPASAELLSANLFGGNYASFSFAIQEKSYQNIRVQCRVPGHTAITSAVYVANNRNDANDGEATCSFFAPATADGEVDLELSICGDYNLCNSQTFKIVKDTTPPSINLINLENSYTQSGSGIEISITDTNLDESSLFYRLYQDGERDDGRNNIALIKRGNRWAFTLPNDLVTGRYNLLITASDTLGNSNELRDDFIMLLDEPTLTLTSPTMTDAAAYTLTAQIDPSTYTGSYTASCAIGQISVPAETSNNLLTCNLNLVDARDGEIIVDITLTADYEKSYSHQLKLIKDTTPPSISFARFRKLYAMEPAIIEISITDANLDESSLFYSIYQDGESGINRVALIKRGDKWIFTLPNDLVTGRYNLLITASDTLGNSNELRDDFIMLLDEPTLTLTSPTMTDAAAYTLTAQIDPGTYTGSYDASCSLGRLTVLANIQNNLLTCNLNLADSSDGNINVDIALTADYEKSYSHQLKLIKDTTPPSINLINLLDSYTQSGSVIEISITDANLDESSLFYRLYQDGESDDERNNVALIKQGSRWIFTLPNNLKTGKYHIIITASDTLGNNNELRKSFLALLDEPTLALTSSGMTRAAAYTLTAQIDPNTYTGSYTASCAIGDQVVPANIQNNLLTCNLNLADSSDGNINVDVVLTADYEKPYTHQLTLIKDITPPSIRVTNSKNIYTQQDNNINLFISDVNLDERSLFYNLNDSNNIALTKESSYWSFILPPTIKTGRHNLLFTAGDTFGNTKELRYEFIVLFDEPVLTLTTPARTSAAAYNLQARIDPGTYTGDYDATCAIGVQVAPAQIQNNLLTCNLNLVDENDGEIVVDIALTADYEKSYSHQLTLIKDTTSPSIRLTTIEDSYTQSGSVIEISIADANLDESSLFYRLYQDGERDDDRNNVALIKRGNRWTFTFPNDLVTGRYNLLITASDTLGNSNELRKSFLALLDEPALTLMSPGMTRAAAYTLTAQIDPGTYTGSYTASCAIGDQVVPANIQNNLLTCNLNLADSRDGDIIVEVALTADYGESYSHQLKLIKDTTSPSIRLTTIEDSYTQSGSVIEISIADANLDESSLFYRLYQDGESDDERNNVALIKRGNRWTFTLPNDLVTGRYNIIITASDTLGNNNELRDRFLMLLDEPTLALTSPTMTDAAAYTLTAQIDPSTYIGDYTASCAIGRQTVPAEISDNLLTCNLNLADSSDGNINVDVALTADYGESYAHQLKLIKDTTPPNIECPFSRGYGGSSTQQVICSVKDLHSAVASVSYRDPTESNRFIELVSPYSITLDPSIYADGDHVIDISAEDELGNAVQDSYSFTVDRTPPVLLLPNQIHTRQDSIDISGTYQEDNIESITCLSLGSGFGQSFDIQANLGEANSFLCQNYVTTNLNLEDRVGVEACDIYSNCATYYTRVLHDDRPPTGNVFAGHVNYGLGLLEDDDSPASPALDLTTAGDTFTLKRDKTTINLEQQIDIAYLQDNKYAFVAWRGRDQQAEIPHPVFNGLHKQLYASNSDNLSVTYSYSQRSCATDNGGNSYTDICPEEKVEYYFQNKKLDINITADGLAEAVIPLTNEYLNAPDKLLWYLAPVDSTIHRIDLYVCDETQNCLQYVARFRVNVLADGPVVNVLDLPETSKNTFKDINSFLTARHNKPIVTRLFEIVNPTAYPVYFTLAENQSPTTMYVQRQTYKRINAYYRRTTTVSYASRTQTYSGGTSYDNRYRCNYSTSYHNVGSIVELLSDTFPAATGRISTTTGEVRGSCSRGGSRTSSFRAAGYPKNVDSQYLTPLGTGEASERSFPMNYHSAVDENNVAYNPESYWLLAPGASKRITIQETLPLYSTYDDGDLSVPSTYTQTPAYNWKGAVYITQGVKIKFGRADYSGLLEPSSVIEFSQANTKPVGVITTERFTVLPGTPK